MAKIEETLKNGGRLKTTRRKLAIGSNRMHALRDEKGNIRNNRDEILKIAEDYYAYLYVCDPEAENSFEITGITGQAPTINTDEVAIALKGMTPENGGKQRLS